MNNHAPTADDIVEQAVAALRATALDDRPPPALIGRTGAALDAAGRAPRPWLATRLGRPLIAIAAAAALAMAATVMIAVVLPSGSGSGSAFAAMLDKVREMKSVRYKLEIRHRFPNNAAESTDTAIITSRADGLQRTEDMKGQRVTIWHAAEGRGILLDTARKTAVVTKAGEAGLPAAIHCDVRDLFRPAAGERIDKLEGKQVGAIASIGYRYKMEQGMLREQQARVYVDPANNLPVLVEGEIPVLVDGKMQASTLSMSDFSWDPPADGAFFSLDPPAGYHVLTELPGPLDHSTSPQEQIAAALRFFASQMEGRLPEGLDERGNLEMLNELWKKIPEHVQKSYAQADRFEQRAIMEKHLGPAYSMRLAVIRAGAVHYLGKGLEAGDGSKIVAWWKAEMPGRAIAVYDDFSWKEIDEPPATP